MRLRDLTPNRFGGGRDSRRAEMVLSPRANVPNTNEWRLKHKLDGRHKPRAQRGNPLWKLGQFLDTVGKYADTESSLSIDEQTLAIPAHAAGIDVPTPLVPHHYKCHAAFPAVPQDHLEHAFVYVVRRMELSHERGDSARQRSTRVWLGRWERAILAELSRREREGDLPAPAIRDGLKLPYSTVEKARQIEIDTVFIAHSVIAPGEIQGEHIDALFIDDPAPGMAAVAADINRALANVAAACDYGVPELLLLGGSPPTTPEQSADLDFFYDRVQKGQEAALKRTRRVTRRAIRNIMREHHSRARR